MKRCLIISIFSIIFLTVIINGQVSADQKSCIDRPKIMAQYELDRGPEGETVLVESFSNYTKSPAKEDERKNRRRSHSYVDGFFVKSDAVAGQRLFLQ